MSLPEINYQHFSLDRASTFRKNTEWLSVQTSLEKAKFMLIKEGDYLFSGNDIVVLARDESSSTLSDIDSISSDVIALLLSYVDTPIFLGLEGELPLFVIDCSTLNEDFINRFIVTYFQELPDTRWKTFKSALPNVDIEYLATLGYGRAISHWSLHHQFCGLCGHKTEILDGGHRRRCTNTSCQKDHFPRTDPAVIMLIEHECEDGQKRCLLAQHQRHDDKVVSTLAGFVDPGETLEQAVAREAHEEAGIVVNEIDYVTTQPWPFPGSLMIGFIAKAESTTLILDEDELVSAQWFTANEIRAFDNWGDISENFRIPREGSIARYLIESWLETQ